jgi:hypothetical protein
MNPSATPDAPPGRTPLRELAVAVAAALTLPNTATTRDELTYLRIARDRARLVVFAMRRILADHEIEGDPGDLMAAVTTLHQQIAELRDHACDHAPAPS